MICEDEPLRPSAALSRVETVVYGDGTTTLVTLKGVSTTRAATTVRLRTQLAGGLDAIVLRALRARDRYQTAQDLGDDRRRYLDRKPLAATSGSWGYGQRPAKTSPRAWRSRRPKGGSTSRPGNARRRARDSKRAAALVEPTRLVMVKLETRVLPAEIRGPGDAEARRDLDAVVAEATKRGATLLLKHATALRQRWGTPTRSGH